MITLPLLLMVAVIREVTDSDTFRLSVPVSGLAMETLIVNREELSMSKS